MPLEALAIFVRVVNRANEWIGRAVSWLTLGVVLVCFSVVVLRYVFNMGFVWMQDIYVWLHAIAFTLGAGYALLHDHHVRVDIIYRPASETYKAWLNLAGVFLLLMPFVSVLIYWGWGYVVRSWELQERSQNVGGMYGLFLVKSCLIGFAIVVAFQGLSMAARSILILTGNRYLLPREEIEPAHLTEEA
jgi:TRAP-type mannitol/chloroaromatic compound transport system permease small subunit